MSSSRSLSGCWTESASSAPTQNKILIVFQDSIKKQQPSAGFKALSLHSVGPSSALYICKAPGGPMFPSYIYVEPKL